MTDEELIEELRNQYKYDPMRLLRLSADCIEQLVADVAGWISNAQAANGWASEAEYKLEVAEAKLAIAEKKLINSSIIEIASSNNRVTEYMFHWEGRALDAEAKLAKAVGVLVQTEQAIMECTDEHSWRLWGEAAVSSFRTVLDELEKTE